VKLETAIFTSIKSSRLDGYQLAAASSGISDSVAKELTVWGPAHDSLWDNRRDARSVNFFRLSAGDYCLSCTTLAGEEYSGRGGGRVYTQIFLLPTDVLARFAYDPFLVLRALAASGRLVVYDNVPEKLAQVPLLGRSDKPDPSLIAQVLDEVGTGVFEELVAAVGSPSSVAVLTSGHVERLFQAVLHAFKPDERLNLSFTTNLKDSPRRPFKLFVLPNDPTIIRQSQRLNDARVVDLVGDHASASASR
jgi:hypothetical protein